VVAAVLVQMLGDLTGRTLFIATEDDARLLCDLLLRRPEGTTTGLEVLERSGLEEVGSILGGAYMDALSEFLGVMILPSVPSLVVDRLAAVLTNPDLRFGRDRGEAVCIQTDFGLAEGDRSMRGCLLFYPDQASLRAILDAVRLD
jgi:chemotaxis protein CheC